MQANEKHLNTWMFTLKCFSDATGEVLLLKQYWQWKVKMLRNVNGNFYIYFHENS